MASLPTGVQNGVSLAPYTTLRAGGKADQFLDAVDTDELANAAVYAQQSGQPFFVLGWGSNILPADDGVPGLVARCLGRQISISREGEVIVDAGLSFQDLFLFTAQAGFGGLEFAVGIPGTVGGALVSNAGAYRSNVSEFLTSLEIVEGGTRRWVGPAWMEFSYRDSVLRRPNPPSCAILRMKFQLQERNPKEIYDEARDYQRQRISKQPAPASAGSFFKNVVNPELAQDIPGLSDGMRKAGVIPAGFLIEAVGMKGYRHGGAMLSPRHANFMLNVAGATGTEIFELAQMAKALVLDRYGVTLEEEVLYLGRWDRVLPVNPPT